MASIGFSVNVSELPASKSYEVLPAGWYDASVTGCELKKTNNGTGMYLAIKYTVLGPTHQGRVVFGNINIQNANAQAEEIGRQQLAELLRSAGIDVFSDTDQLIGATIQAKVAIRKQEGYDDSNDVKGFKPMQSGAQVMPSAQAMPSAMPAQPAAYNPQYAAPAPQPAAQPMYQQPAAAPAQYSAPAPQAPRFAAQAPTAQPAAPSFAAQPAPVAPPAFAAQTQDAAPAAPAGVPWGAAPKA